MKKRIQGFEDYEITDDGKVISHKTYHRHNYNIELKYWICNSGYKMVQLCQNNKTYKFSVHKLVAKHFVDGWFEEAVVNHIDGNKLNNNANNLEWVTVSENTTKGYITTGIDQFRHYNIWKIKYPTGELSEELKGISAIKKHVQDNNLSCSALSLHKYYKSKGYELIKVS